MSLSFLRPPMLLTGAILGALLLAGCGGGTKTETVADTPLPEETTRTAPSTPTTTTTQTTPPTSTATTPSEHGGTSAPTTTTRTAPEPAFTHETTSTGATAEGLSAAEAVLQARGYTATATSDYHPNQTLRVLVGTGSAEGSGQQAFFFLDGRYIGTDTKQPSASIHVVSQGDTEVTLAYSQPGSPGAGPATVRFQLNNGKLVPLNSIPSANSRQ
jgi:hypothetical protein